MLLEKFTGKKHIVRLELDPETKKFYSKDYILSVQDISSGKIDVEFRSLFYQEMETLFKEYAARSDI